MDNSSAENQTIRMEIFDLLGQFDMSGIEFLTDDRVERLEQLIVECNKRVAKFEEPLVEDSVYDLLCDILKQVNPDAEVLHKLWSEYTEDEEDSINENDDTFSLLTTFPMKSICTCKSINCKELADFINRMPDGFTYTPFVSMKENGHGVRAVFRYGDYDDGTSRARRSAGHNLKNQLRTILKESYLDHIVELEPYPLVEIRGEVILSFSNYDIVKSQYNKDIASPFSGVSSLLRDSATPEEVKLLSFIAYHVVSTEEDLQFSKKSEEYEFLSNCGFTVPLARVTAPIQKEQTLNVVQFFVNYMEQLCNEEGYDVYTDGVVYEVDERDKFNQLGSDDKYNFGNVALKMGKWSQDMFSGYVQTIMWTDGKSKLSPVAIVAEEPDMIIFKDPVTGDTIEEDVDYITSQKEVENWSDLGVHSLNGNKVRRVPLYEPANILALQAFKGNVIHFRYGGEAGVVPCYPDGTTLTESKVADMFSNAVTYDDEEYDGDADLPEDWV